MNVREYALEREIKRLRAAIRLHAPGCAEALDEDRCECDPALTMFWNADREFTADDLARQLDITVQGANNRLKRLLDDRLLERRWEVPPGGGKFYVYRLHSDLR